MKKRYIALQQVKDLINAQPKEVKAEYELIVNKLQENGRLVMPFGEKVENKLFAIRVVRAGNIRVFYVYGLDDKIYGIYGYVKKTRSIPQKELKQARKILKLLSTNNWIQGRRQIKMNTQDKKLEEELNKINKNFDKLHKKEQAERKRFLNASENKEAVLKAIANMELSEKLYKLRKRAKLTQQQLAEKLHIKQPTYARMENGQNLTINKIYQIAEACNANVDIKFHLKHV